MEETPTITIELNQEEINALIALIDSGVKATGINGAKIAALILDRLVSSVAKTNAESNKEQTPKLEVVD